MNRFLNRLPTITIREGHRVKVYLTSDSNCRRTWSPAQAAAAFDEEVVMSRRILARRHRASALVATPAHAQLAVIDPANLAQAVLIASARSGTTRSCRRSTARSCAWRRASATWSGYRIPPIAIDAPRRRPLGVRTAWIQGLNSGDADRGRLLGDDAAAGAARPRCRAGSAAGARRALERQYATIEITDSVAMMGGHRSALVARLPRPAAAGRAGARRRRAERPAPAITR